MSYFCYSVYMEYEAVIGLEIHAELKTKTKMFCQSLNDPLELHPNVNVCPVCMAHPGTLPVINKDAVKKVIAVGLALNGEIPEFSQFDRKHYFYPDLPKGYQISQYEHPLVSGGYLDIESNSDDEDNKFPISNFQFPNKSQTANSKDQKMTIKRIRITRVHLEEDTGRLSHDPASGSSLVDFNRAGVPLMELVTEPDFRTGKEVIAFGEELQKILRYVGASDADMEKGQMRVEVNISLRPKGSETYGTKVEVKNINSFKYAADAAAYEYTRQKELREAGETIVQETRGWNETKGQSISQRKKESAHDYCYFPEPDLPPLHISREMVEQIKAKLPELPAQKRNRFEKEYLLDASMAGVICHDKAFAEYFEETISELGQHAKEAGEEPHSNLAKIAAGFMTRDFMRLLSEKSASVREVLIQPENLAELVFFVADNKISHLAAKEVLEEMFEKGDDPSDIIDRRGLWQISDALELEDMARLVIERHPEEVRTIRNGKTATLQFLVGQVMKESRGKANPKIVQEILRKIIG